MENPLAYGGRMPPAPNMTGIRAHLCMMLAAALCGATGLAAAPVVDRVAFPGSIKDVPAVAAGAKRVAMVSRSTLLASEGAQTMTFEVALRMRSFDELQARIARGEQIA